MSRASDLRDAIVAELKEQLSTFDADRIDSFLIPDYDKEELQEPRVGVRIGRREVEVDQGPDSRLLSIQVGVIGLVNELDPKKPVTKESVRQQAIDSADVLDAIIEEVIAIWTPCGPLATKGLAGHSFVSITQPYPFDPTQLYQNDVWVSIVELIYRDCEDE
jgi:hypothetical protein